MKSTIDKKNVVGIAKGEKWTNGRPTGQRAVLVFVESKESLSKLDPEDVVESHIDGLPTDVVGKVGRITASRRPPRRNPTRRTRPIFGGLSVSHRKVTAGTIGVVCRDKDKDIVILSNNHVLANSNNAHAGDVIYQPGTYDRRPKPNGVIGYLKDFVKLKNGVSQDSAIAKVTVPHSGIINYIGAPRRIRSPKMRLRVFKSGRTSRHTRGRIIATRGKFRVWYSKSRSYLIKNCIVTNDMSQGGDSGSLLVDGRRRPIGLLFAGSNTVTLYNPIGLVLERYGLTIL